MDKYPHNILHKIVAVLVFAIHLSGYVALGFEHSFANSSVNNSVNSSANEPLGDNRTKHLPYFTAEYEAVYKGFSITATREFKPVNDREAELSFEANSWIASLTETSKFIWDKDKIKPSDYRYRRSVAGQSKERSMIFDGYRQEIISHYKDKKQIIPNPQQALDKLSFQLQLQYDLLNKRDNLSYTIADRGRIKQYQFEIVARELIDTNIGTLETIKVKVIRDNTHKQHKRLTYFWMAPKWHNLLTRMEQYEDGKKEFEIHLTGAMINGKVVSGS